MGPLFGLPSHRVRPSTDPFPEGSLSLAQPQWLDVHLQKDLGLPFIAHIRHCASFLVGERFSNDPRVAEGHWWHGRATPRRGRREAVSREVPETPTIRHRDTTPCLRPDPQQVPGALRTACRRGGLCWAGPEHPLHPLLWFTEPCTPCQGAKVTLQCTSRSHG